MPESSDPRPSDGPADGPAEDPAEEPAAGPAADDVFAELVAHFDEEPDARDWPAAEDVGRPRRAPAGRDGVVFTGDPRTLGYADDADDGHYVPPPPPRAGRIRPATAVAVLAIVLGIAVLALPELVAQVTNTATQEVTGVLLILGGVGSLVARMADRAPDDDDPDDDGAVI
jgi:hypothetical protein